MKLPFQNSFQIYATPIIKQMRVLGGRGGGYANKFIDLKNVWGGYAKIF